MAGKKRSAKDKQMAAYLRKIKDVRKTGRCVICYKIVPMNHVCTGAR